MHILRLFVKIQQKDTRALKRLRGSIVLFRKDRAIAQNPLLQLLAQAITKGTREARIRGSEVAEESYGWAVDVDIKFYRNQHRLIPTVGVNQTSVVYCCLLLFEVNFAKLLSIPGPPFSLFRTAGLLMEPQASMETSIGSSLPLEPIKGLLLFVVV